MEEQMTGNPNPSENVEYYTTIEEKEETCKKITEKCTWVADTLK